VLIQQILFGARKMILLQQLRSFFITISLAVVLATAIVFGFGSTNSWAATSLTQLISPSPTQIATMKQAETMTKNMEGKAQEAIGDLTGDSKTQAAGRAKQLKAKTLGGIDNSIENSNYHPGGKTKQAGKQDREATADMESEARDAFK
jgi:uncharacterized protein YjbJ (UPF0337 family)